MRATALRSRSSPSRASSPRSCSALAAYPSQACGDALLGCIDWVAHGFEIVQSIFPGWTFAPADTVAAYGLHGALLIGPRQAPAASGGWLHALETFDIGLFRNGALADRGRAANVLDGPLHALRHLVDLLARDRLNPPLAAGEIVTTGTLTRALPVVPGRDLEHRIIGHFAARGADPVRLSPPIRKRRKALPHFGLSLHR